MPEVHNHGPEEGPGLSCPEVMVKSPEGGARLIGRCMAPPEPPVHSLVRDAAGVHWQRGIEGWNFLGSTRPPSTWWQVFTYGGVVVYEASSA
jgi:hypothetical protein